jgi:hypothetical protein
MDQDLKALVTIAERLLEGSRKLARENASLRERLENCESRIELLNRRAAEARARVEAALERLPTLSDLSLAATAAAVAGELPNELAPGATAPASATEPLSASLVATQPDHSGTSLPPPEHSVGEARPFDLGELAFDLPQPTPAFLKEV